MQDFEGLFSDFLDSTEYDRAEGAVFSLMRMAFKAGWLAAGGKPTIFPEVTQLLDAKYMNVSDRD